MMDEKIEKFIVVSYIPLLYPSKRMVVSPSAQYATENSPNIAKELTESISSVPDVHVKACLWVHGDNDQEPFCPVLLIDNATEVADHLLHWCENDPTAWFGLYLNKIDANRYIVLLFPNLLKSIERFKLACLIHGGFVPPSDAHFDLIFKPLEFLSQTATMFDSLKDRLGNEFRVGFLNTGEFDQENPEACLSKVRYIGPISRLSKADEEDPQSYIGTYIKDRLASIDEDDDE